MGILLSTVETVTIAKKSLDEYMDKYDKTVEELLSVKAKLEQVSVENQELQTINESLRKKSENQIQNLEQHANNLKEKNAKLESSIIRSKDNLEKHNSSLKNYISRLQDELKLVNADNYILENKIKENEVILNNQRSIINIFEKDLIEVKKKLEAETVTDETLRKIIQIYHRIKELQEAISTKIDVIVKQIKENNREEKEKLIEQLKSDYDNYEKILESKNIAVNRTGFIDIYAKYKHLSQRNDDNKKNILMEIYQIEKSAKKLQGKYEIFARDLSKAVDQKAESEKQMNMNVLAQDLTVEEELYQEVLKIAREEISFREKFINIDTAKISQIKDCNILNNLEDGCRASGPSTSSESTSVILFNAPNGNQSENEDYLMVKAFLAQNGIVDEGVAVRRYGKYDSARPNRPLIINFANRYYVDRIFQLSKNFGWFHGHNPDVRVYLSR